MYEWYKCQNHSYKFWCWSVMRCWHSEMCWHSEASNIGLAINLHHRPYNTLAPPCKCGTKRSCQIDRHSLLISHNQVVCIPFHSTHTHVKMRMPLPNCSMVMYWYRLIPAACRICLHSSSVVLTATFLRGVLDNQTSQSTGFKSRLFGGVGAWNEVWGIFCLLQLYPC